MTGLRHHISPMSDAGGPYCHAVVDDNYAFLSGQLAADAKHRKVKIGDIDDEARAAMELLQGVLAGLGLDFSDVTKVNVYMTDLTQFERMNEVYVSFLAPGRCPARTTVGVATLLFGCQVEIDCVARLRPVA